MRSMFQKKKEPKPFYKSETIQGGLIVVVSILTITITNSFNIATRRVESEALKQDLADVQAIVLELVKGIVPLLGAGMAIHGRMKANESGGVYTPHGLPGADKEDFAVEVLEPRGREERI